jgi:hypothetical protein
LSSGHRRPGARQYIVGIQSSITIICVEERVSHDNTGPIDGERRLMEWIQAYDPRHDVWLSSPSAMAGRQLPIVSLIALVTIVGIIVMLQAYVFTWMVPAWP